MITEAHLTEGRMLGAQQRSLREMQQEAARKLIASPGFQRGERAQIASHRKSVMVGHAPLAGIKLPKIPLPSTKLIRRVIMLALLVILGAEVMLAAGVKLSTYQNPGDKGWVFGNETTFVGVDHSRGESDLTLCIGGHLVFGPSCG